MKKYLVLAALVAISTGAMAGDGAGKFKKGDFTDKLTEQQRECFESYGCPKAERKKGEKISREEMEQARECHNKAFESCGIEKPADRMDKKRHKKNG